MTFAPGCHPIRVEEPCFSAGETRTSPSTLAVIPRFHEDSWPNYTDMETGDNYRVSANAAVVRPPGLTPLAASPWDPGITSEMVRGWDSRTS